MKQVLSIVGKSKTGKTTLLEKIIQVLTQKGYQIGTIKHDTHGFEIDYPKKDSYRHFHAGSQATLILSPNKLALVQRLDKPWSLDDIINKFFNDVDLVITEGFKRENKPKIEIVRAEIDKTASCQPEGNNLIALVSDVDIDGYPVPRFHLDDINGIVGFIEEEFLCQAKRRKPVRTDIRPGG